MHKLYEASLERARQVKLDRDHFYGDSWLDTSLDYLVTAAQHKLAKVQRTEGDEKRIDDLLDAINYAAFAVGRIIAGTKKDWPSPDPSISLVLCKCGKANCEHQSSSTGSLPE